MFVRSLTFKRGSPSVAASRVTHAEPHMGAAAKAPPQAQLQFREAFYYLPVASLSPHAANHQEEQGIHSWACRILRELQPFPYIAAQKAGHS